MGLIQGGSIRVKLGTKTVFHAINADLSSEKEIKEVSSKDGKDIVISAGPWSVAGSKLIYDEGDQGATQMATNEMLDAHFNDTILAFEYTDGVSGNFILTGEVYVTRFNLSANDKEEATINYTLTGKGDLTKSTVA